MANIKVFFSNTMKAKFTDVDKPDRGIIMMTDSMIGEAIEKGFPNNIPAGRVVVNWTNVAFICAEREEPDDDVE